MIATIEDLKLEFWLRKRENGEILWKTKKGEFIDIRKMSDNHLKNTINMLERNAEYSEYKQLEELRYEFEAENFGDR